VAAHVSDSLAEVVKLLMQQTLINRQWPAR